MKINFEIKLICGAHRQTPNGEPESNDINLIRAIMNLGACVADQKRVIDGLKPIRPLESYPDPMAYFKG